MEREFDIIRINKLEKSITVLLRAAGHELQQDIPVMDFMDMDAIKAEIDRHLDKLETDIAATKGKVEEVHEDLQAMVDKYTKSFKGDLQPK